jgi:hypothetical protein
MPVQQEPIGAQIGQGGAGFTLWQYNVDNYSDLSGISNPQDGDIAKVKNSEGTKWLPGSLGGTYYPSGFYCFNSLTGVWDMDNTIEAIAEELDNILDTKLSSVQAGSNITIDNTDPINPIINSSDVKRMRIGLLNSQNINNVAATVVDFSDILDNNIVGASVLNGVITLPIGEYKMSYIICGQNSSSQRSNVLVLGIKGAGGGAGFIRGANSYGYYRGGANDFGQNSIPPTQGGLLNFTAVGTLALSAARVGQGGSCNTLLGQSQLIIEKIK